MRAKEYLRKLHKLDISINQKIEELNALRKESGLIGGIDYSKDRVQSSQETDAPFVRTILRMEQLEEEINSEIDAFVDEKHKIINQIQVLSNPVHVKILYMRYVQFKRLEAIAVEMDYSYQYTRELHGAALQEFQTSYTNLHFGVVE